MVRVSKVIVGIPGIDGSGGLSQATAEGLFAEKAVGERLSTRVFDAREHGASHVAADNITAINAAIAEAAADVAANGGTARVVVGASAKTFAVRPDPASDHWIKLQSGVTLDLSDVTLRVADDAPPYLHLMTGTLPTTLLERVRITGGMIDQNPLGNITADVQTGGVSNAFAVLSYNFNGVMIDGVTLVGMGVNTVSLNDADGVDAAILDNTFSFVRGATTQPDYDNSSVYLSGRGMRANGNRFFSTIPEGARGAIELHGPDGEMVGNTAEGYQTLVNLVSTAISGDGAESRSQLVVTGNTGTDLNYGIQIWLVTGTTLANVVITDNPLHMAQKDWDLVSTTGIGVNRGASLTGTLDGVTIADNIVTFQSGDTRVAAAGGAALVHASTVGIGLNGNGTIRNGKVTDNLILNAPAYGLRVGDSAFSTKEVRMVDAHDNLIIDAGQNPNMAQRAAVSMFGTLYDVDIHDNRIRDTGAVSPLGQYACIVGPVGGARNTFSVNRQRTASGTALANSLSDTYVNFNFKRVTQDVASIAAGGSATFDVTVRGAAINDIAVAQPLQGLEAGLTYHAAVVSANTVRVRINNPTAGAIDPAIRQWRIRLLKEDVDIT